MPYLFWLTIQEATSAGCRTLDLGRTDLDNPGRAQFKSYFGTACSTLTYYPYPPQPPPGLLRTWAAGAPYSAFAHLPDWGLVAAGNLLHKHLS
jgi:hypothetical protein